MKLPVATFTLVLVLALSLCCFPIDLVAQKYLGGPGVILLAEDPRPFVGIQMIDADGGGVSVSRLVPGSPAEKAGLKPGDILLKLNDTEVLDRDAIAALIRKSNVGDTIKCVAKRKGEEVSVSIVLGRTSDFFPAQETKGLKVVEPKTIQVPSADGLSITIDAYAPYTAEVPTIILCHQAGWSRGEYREIAPKLNEMGFNCYAIDQRSGGSVNDVVNETNKRAVVAGKDVAFVDAEQDILAVLTRMRAENKKLILWGSSYSAALALRIAGEHPKLVDGVLAFAPGEYFTRSGKSDDWVATSAKKIQAPAFVTSAKKELKQWKSIYDAIPTDSKAMFLPETTGNHGSRALWEKFDDNDVYWKATSTFLAQFASEQAAAAKPTSSQAKD